MSAQLGFAAGALAVAATLSAHRAVRGRWPFGAIVGATIRALLGRWRILFVLLFLAIPILLAMLARATADAGFEGMQEVAIALLDSLVVRVVLPLVALFIGTAVLGAEVDDGTIVFLLVNPVPRWEIIAAKLFVAEVVTLVLVVPVTAVTGAILVTGAQGVDPSIATGFTVGVAAGAVVYVAIFLAMSVVTSRALALGLGYVLIWEGFLASLFAGTRNLSVREYTLSIAQQVAGVDLTAGQAIAPALAVVMSVVVTVVAVAIAIRRLGSFSITGGS
jgi:ABC-2 type transport system permease protein